MMRNRVRPATNHDVTWETDCTFSTMVFVISWQNYLAQQNYFAHLRHSPALHYAIICAVAFSSPAVGGGACANLTGGEGTVSGMDTLTVAAGSGAGFDTSCVFASTFFALLRGGLTSCVFARTFFALLRGGVTPEASRNSSKLNFRNASKRRRSGAACTSPLNPKNTVPS